MRIASADGSIRNHRGSFTFDIDTVHTPYVHTVWDPAVQAADRPEYGKHEKGNPTVQYCSGVVDTVSGMRHQTVIVVL